MEKGLSIETRYIEKLLSEEAKIEINLIEKESKNYELVNYDFKEELDNFYTKTTDEEAMSLRNYTGYNFRRINAILRNNWNYEEHGKKDEKVVEVLTEDIKVIDSLLKRFPKNKNAFMTYRGAALSSFKKYGIESLDDLINLKGKFLYETGYTSTSLNEKESYFNKKIMDKFIDVEIKYLIPPDSQDGIPLITDDLSYSKNQQEYLIERNSLSKVLDVEIKNDSAILTVVLIPKKIWDKKDIKQEQKSL